jgi:uncharacterized membrane protein YkoI
MEVKEMKYMILEIHKSHCIALDEAGRFVKAVNFGYEVGQSVDSIHELTSRETHNPIIKRAIAFAGIAACFVLCLSVVLHSVSREQAPFASIYLMINPQVRVDVNEDGIVSEITAINPHGAALLHQFDAVGLSMTETFDSLADRALALNFVHKDERITIVIASDDDDWFERAEAAIFRNFDTFLSELIFTEIVIKRHVGPDSAPVPSPFTSQRITRNEALSIVLDYLDITMKDMDYLETELERELSQIFWEIEFFLDGIEYEFEVDAFSGEIILMEIDGVEQ